MRILFRENSLTYWPVPSASIWTSLSHVSGLSLLVEGFLASSLSTSVESSATLFAKEGSLMSLNVRAELFRCLWSFEPAEISFPSAEKIKES